MKIVVVISIYLFLYICRRVINSLYNNRGIVPIKIRNIKLRIFVKIRHITRALAKKLCYWNSFNFLLDIEIFKRTIQHNLVYRDFRYIELCFIANRPIDCIYTSILITRNYSCELFVESNIIWRWLYLHIIIYVADTVLPARYILK